jgi:hypothetical protein
MVFSLQSSQAELPHVASSEFPASAVPTANKANMH